MAGKIFDQIIKGTSDNNVSFAELIKLLEKIGFRCRIKGSHHIFTKSGVNEIINLQPNGTKAKAYQVKQVRQLIMKYKIDGDGL